MNRDFTEVQLDQLREDRVRVREREEMDVADDETAKCCMMEDTFEYVA